MAGIFKAYDVRGIYPDELDERIARAIGRSFPCLLTADEISAGDPVVVSRDMRAHSVPLSEALIGGLLEAGLDVLDVGLATTPMNYFAVGHLGAVGGIQVTASHNPARYNGFKLSRSDARPVSGDHGIPLLERTVAEGSWKLAASRGELSQGEILEEYGRHVLSFLEPDPGGRRLKVAVDAANGMGTIYRPLLERTRIELVPLYFELDGTFPNHPASPIEPDTND